MAEHPIHILPWDGTLGPEHMQKLAESATSRTDHPSAPGAVIFTFSASEINDVRDRTIIADPGSARRILAAMTDTHADGQRWPFSDGTALRPHGSSGAWLEIERAKTRRTAEDLAGPS